MCCADFGGGDGGTLAALEDAGLGALGIDAAALSSEAGAAGLAGLGGINFKVTCEDSCTGSQIQACAGNAECASGGTCVPLTSLLGDASALGDAGGAVPAGFSMYATALGMDMACIPPVSEAGSPVDAAAPVEAAAPIDAGTPTDAVAPTDAPVDAVSE